MEYPTLPEVEQATQYQLGKWLRFLHSPGMRAIDRGITGAKLDDTMHQESKVLDRIRERFDGWTPHLSKAVGW